MKKIIIIVLLLLVPVISRSQIKQRSMKQNVYVGIGFKLIWLTDPQASDAYPFFQLSGGDFLKEIDGIIGITLNEQYGFEFSPGYLYSNALNNDGYYYDSETERRFYVPTQSRFYTIPLNAKFKYYPFAKNYSSSFSKMYFGIGAGPMYINEEITGQIYSDEGQVFIGNRSASDNFWTGNYEIMIGTGSFSKIGFGFEVSYRFVPLPHDVKSNPLITSLATNFNSINLTGNILFSF
ncbi:MAG TPA: hypothetical protein PKA90_01520 [Ignavibacteria bacterium]|nr:hypothetical protein [Ignavibacteria bacterium]HMR39085.1 hypothetical protein [Ignavibacteria bacterium]